MSIKGKRKEGKDFVKETGFFEGEVIVINPDRENLEKLLGTTLEKDPEYLGKDVEGNRKLNLCIWLKDVKTGKARQARFFLKEVKKQNRDKTKTQYINEIGATSWCDTEANLPDWFKAKAYRPAWEGEEELYNFVINWLNKLDTRDADAALSFDWNKLMNGNVKELSDQIGGEYEGTIIPLVVIRTVEKDIDGSMTPVDYEQIYSKDFLPGYVMKQIRTRKPWEPSFLRRSLEVEKKKRSRLQKFVISVKDTQYGVKDYFTLGELEEYDPSKNVATTDKVISEEDTSY